MKTVITHNGVFHSDDVLGVALIKLYLGEKIKIKRSRDSKIWSEGDFLVDVGGELDFKTKFDHHHDKSLLGACFQVDKGLSVLRNEIWKDVAVLVGARDVGVELEELEGTSFVYEGKEYRLSSRDSVAESQMYIDWVRENIPHDQSEMDNVFVLLVNKTVELIKNEELPSSSLKEEVEMLRRKNEGYKKECIAKAEEILAKAEGRVIFLPEFIPFWNEAINGKTTDALWVSWYDPEQNNYAIQTVPEEPNSFKFKEEAFLTEEMLPGAIFVHKGGFHARVKSKEEVMRLVQ